MRESWIADYWVIRYADGTCLGEGNQPVCYLRRKDAEEAMRFDLRTCAKPGPRIVRVEAHLITVAARQRGAA